MNVKDVLQEVAAMLENRAGVNAVFGEPVVRGDVTVIPVARVAVCGGGCNCSRSEESGESGRGLGLSARTVPVGYIEIGATEACFVEIRDRNRQVLAGLGVAAFGIWTLGRVLSRLIKKR
jgi:uncharacterized spore protein YtfJ